MGERFYIYASGGGTKGGGATKRRSDGATKGGGIWSRDLVAPGEPPPAWMIELAEQVKLIEPGAILPTGVIVGSAVIEKVIPPNIADGEAGLFRWQLKEVKRLARPRKPRGHPQPAWFNAF